jgi:Spy/CpxP family protein refolding chaperone
MKIRNFTPLFVFAAAAAVLGHQQPARADIRGPEDQKPQSQSVESRPGPRPPRPPSRWWTNEKYRQELKLTVEQTAQIDKIFQGSMERMKAQKEDFDRAQSDFSQLMKKGMASERDLLRAADSLELARFKVSSERTSMLVRIHSVLTPEQRLGLQAISKRDRDDDKNNNRSR